MSENISKVLQDIETNGMDAELKEQIDNLKESLAEYTPGPALQITSHFDFANSIASDKLKQLMQVKSKALTVLIEKPDKVAECMYLCAKIKTSNIQTGIKELVGDLEKLADAGLIHSFLCTPSSIDLLQQTLEEPCSAVFVYPLVPADKIEEAKKLIKYNIRAMENTDEYETIGETKVALGEGEFIAEVKISVAMNMIQSSGQQTDAQAKVHNQINEFLKFLPEGTELVSVKECGINGLSIPFRVTFRNPRLVRVKTVELKQTRASAIVNDKLEQFTVTTGIRFLDANREDLF